MSAPPPTLCDLSAIEPASRTRRRRTRDWSRSDGRRTPWFTPTPTPSAIPPLPPRQRPRPGAGPGCRHRGPRWFDRSSAGVAHHPPALLDAFAAVDRADFLPGSMREHAYEDRPQPIGGGQTISQPQIVAVMAEALELGPGDRVLDVGTGSGDAAAILAELAGEVFTIERRPELAAEARRRLAAEPRPAPVHVRIGDGSLGWPDAAPSTPSSCPPPGPACPRPCSSSSLPVDKRLVMPVGTGTEQQLVRVAAGRRGRRLVARGTPRLVCFVPLLGEAGWAQPHPPPRDPRPSTPGRAPEPTGDGRRGRQPAAAERSRGARVPDELLYATNDHVVTITFNRPDRTTRSP